VLQHPARHHAPADELGPLGDAEIERSIARDVHRLPDLVPRGRPRVRVGELEIDRGAPVTPGDPLR
jgi:hypothetical protein